MTWQKNFDGGLNLKIYLTRHGETKWNVEKRLQGWGDSPLTKNGIEKAHLFKDLVKDVDFDAIYTSDQKRAIETAKIIRDRKAILIIQDKRLRELGFGGWEGLTLDEIKENDKDLFETYLNDPLLYKPKSGETISDLFKRLHLILDEIEKNQGENILIVSHGVTIRAIIAILKDYEIEEYKKTPVYQGASLSIFEKKDGAWVSLLEGDTSHFKD